MSDSERQLNKSAAGKNKALNKRDGIFWAVGLVLTALSVSLAARSGFGVSMVVAPAYVLHLKLVEIFPWFSFGVAEFLTQFLLIAVMILIIRDFRLRYVLTFGTAAIYGAILDMWRSIVGTEVPEAFGARLAFAAGGILICGFAIALMFRTSWPQEAYDMFVKDVSEHLDIDTDKFKWGYDIASLLTAIALMLILFRTFSFEMIGPGTLVTTIVNAPLIAMFGRLIDKTFPAASE